MKNIFFILIILVNAASAQTVSEPYKLWPRSNFRPPQDTVIAPERLGELRYKSSDAKFYKAISLTGNKWAEFGVGGGGGLSVSNESNDRVITSTGAGTANAETTLTYNGSILKVDDNFQTGVGMDATQTYVTAGRTSNFPYVVWNNKTGSANERIWDMYAYNNVFSYRLINDTYTGALEWMKILRSGMTVTSIDYPSGRVLYGATDDNSTKLQVGGNITAGSPASILIGNIGSDYARKIGLGETSAGFPNLYFRNASAGTDSKMYDWYFDNSGASVFRAVNDAYSGASNIWEINRSGTTITAFKFPFLSGSGTRVVTATSDGTLGTSALSTVSGSGAFSSKIRVVDNADFTVESDDYTVLIKNNTTTRTATVFAASGNTNRVLRIVNTGTAALTSSVALRISPSTTLTSISANTTVEVHSDGTDLWIIGIFNR
jgi:hypothetical protein